jgi:hypothetical protein
MIVGDKIDIIGYFQSYVGWITASYYQITCFNEHMQATVKWLHKGDYREQRLAKILDENNIKGYNTDYYDKKYVVNNELSR